MFGPVERQSLCAVVVHHLRDAGENTAALVQSEAVLFGLSHDDVDTPLARFEGDGVLAVVRFAVPDQEAGFFAGQQLKLCLLASHIAMVPTLFLQGQCGVDTTHLVFRTRDGRRGFEDLLCPALLPQVLMLSGLRWKMLWLPGESEVGRFLFGLPLRAVKLR